ncbi:uncharacterized protein CEXT_222511 [Caerostris extrusa]|uniref:Uncharacterized protein n=1 Tax=Caerostris extrusa TaxID=172846 RepID=A0AAV4P062_CAEEX|nr:uncharacterized protein CEXT_222511 [Caerostris extrusa]
MDDVQSCNSMISSNNNYFKSSKSINELVLRLGQKSFEEIHIVCQHRDAKHKIPPTSKTCPRHIHEQKILEFKCRNHLTIGEARRIYAQSSKTNYSDAAKTNTTAPNIEEIVNQRVESIVQNITIKMEQTTLLIEIFQKTIENLVQYLVSVFHQTDLKKSPNRKRQMINLVPPTNNPMQWDAGGSNASD